MFAQQCIFVLFGFLVTNCVRLLHCLCKDLLSSFALIQSGVSVPGQNKKFIKNRKKSKNSEFFFCKQDACVRDVYAKFGEVSTFEERATKKTKFGSVRKLLFTRCFVRFSLFCHELHRCSNGMKFCTHILHSNIFLKQKKS